GDLKIEYWLISGYGSSCPAKDSNLATNWTYIPSNGYCTAYSYTDHIPQANPSPIPSYHLKGYADIGGNDEAVFCNGGSCNAEAVAYTVLHLASHWQYS